MSMRPMQLWKSMPADQRVLAAEAFWRDDQSDTQLQHAEAVVSIARRMNFRPKSVQALPVERRAKMLAQMPDISDLVATRALIAYHFTQRRDLMAAFLNALGIAHENGLIQEENVAPPDRERLQKAIEELRTKFPESDVDLYLRTLVALDSETWSELAALLET